MANKSKVGQNRSADKIAQGRQSSSGAGRGWHGNSEGHASAGRKGGQTVSRDRDHMAEIGRKGGQTVSRDRDHMAEIGRKGGQARKVSDTPQKE